MVFWAPTVGDSNCRLVAPALLDDPGVDHSTDAAVGLPGLMLLDWLGSHILETTTWILKVVMTSWPISKRRAQKATVLYEGQ